MKKKPTVRSLDRPLSNYLRRPPGWQIGLIFACALLSVASYTYTATANSGWTNFWNRVTTIDSSNGNAGKIKRNAVFRNIPSSVAYDEYLTKARRGVEALRRKIEQWGTVTISAPVVIAEKGQFAFAPNDLTTTASNYVQMELTGVAGGSYVTDETAFSNSAALSASRTVQPNAVTGLPEPVLDGSTSAANAPSAPTINNINTVLAGGTGSFAPPGSLLSGANIATTGIPVRTAVNLGMNDKLTERIYQNLADPNWGYFPNQDYEIFFAIVQVSCNPGWRTRTNYIADVSATLDYSDQFGNIMPEARHKHPLVFSVLPLLDAQNLELGSSDRSLTSLAGQLNASYPTVGLSLLGQDLITFVHRHQKDSITRSPITVTNSYSSGRSFGFRLAPSFVAQKDPGYKKSGAADVLSATSFPVLIIAVVNLSDIWSEPPETGYDKSKDADPEPQTRPRYDSVAFQVSNRWLINDRPPFSQVYRRWFMPLKQETFSMRCNWAEDVADIKNLLDEASTNYRLYLGARRIARDRYENGESQPTDGKATLLPSAGAANTPSRDNTEEDDAYIDPTAYAATDTDRNRFVVLTGDNGYGVEFDPVLSLLRKEVEHYEAVTNAFAQTFTMFPASDVAAPIITGSYPGSVPVRGNFTLVLQGSDLRNVQKVIIGGKSSSTIVHFLFAKSGTDSLLCSFNSGEIRFNPSVDSPLVQMTSDGKQTTASTTGITAFIPVSGSSRITFQSKLYSSSPGSSPPPGSPQITSTSGSFVSDTSTLFVSSTSTPAVSTTSSTVSSSSATVLVSGAAAPSSPAATGTFATTLNATFPSMLGGSGQVMGTTEIVLVTNAGAYAGGSINVVDYDGDKGSPQSGAAASSTPGAAVTAANMTTSGTGIVLSTSTAGNIISINTNITPTPVTGTAAKTGT